jgi:hypothetical protein
MGNKKPDYIAIVKYIEKQLLSKSDPNKVYPDRQPNPDMIRKPRKPLNNNNMEEETLPMADCIDCDVCTCGKKPQENEITSTQEECFCGKQTCDCE